jgi:hypothetical protein
LYRTLDGPPAGADPFSVALDAPEAGVESHAPDGLALATFAAGCFWGLEAALAGAPGVARTAAGYTQARVGECYFAHSKRTLTG